MISLFVTFYIWANLIIFLFWLQIDHSVVESFGEGGKTCITSRVYPSLAVANKAHLYVFNNGSETVTIEKLNAWNMRRPQVMNNK